MTDIQRVTRALLARTWSTRGQIGEVTGLGLPAISKALNDLALDGHVQTRSPAPWFPDEFTLTISSLRAKFAKRIERLDETLASLRALLERAERLALVDELDAVKHTMTGLENTVHDLRILADRRLREAAEARYGR